MAKIYSPKEYPCLRYFIGDVRDKERLYRAFQNVDIVVMRPALQAHYSMKYNPIPSSLRQISMGRKNIINVAAGPAS